MVSNPVSAWARSRIFRKDRFSDAVPSAVRSERPKSFISCGDSMIFNFTELTRMNSIARAKPAFPNGCRNTGKKLFYYYNRKAGLLSLINIWKSGENGQKRAVISERDGIFYPDLPPFSAVGNPFVYSFGLFWRRILDKMRFLLYDYKANRHFPKERISL